MTSHFSSCVDAKPFTRYNITLQSKRLLRLSCLLIATISPLNAQPISIDIPLGELAQPTQTGEVDHTFTTGFSKQLHRDTFEDKITSVAEVISKESGIQIRQTGGFGGFSSVSLRGSSSEQVLVYLDGMLLNSAAGGGVDLSTLSLTSVERIDIYRGSTPLSLGSASIGGAINLKSLNAKEAPIYQLSVGAASFNTQQYALYLSSIINDLEYVITADHFETENDYRFLNGTKTRFNSNDDTVDHRNNNHVKKNNLLAKLGYKINNDSRIDVITQWFKKNQGLPSWNNHQSTRTHFENQRWQVQARLINNNLGPYQLKASHELKYMLAKEEYDDRQAQISLGQQHNFNQTTTYSARQYLEATINNQLIGFNIELRKQRYAPEDLLNLKDYAASTRNTVSTGLDYKLFTLENNLILNPALNSTWSKDQRHSRLTGKETGLSNHYIEPRFGIKYHVNNHWVVKSNLGSYIREPSFLEFYGTQGRFKGNEELLNEEGVNFDIGLEFNKKDIYRHLDEIDWQITYFQNDIKKQITRTYNSRGIGTSTNIERVKIDGIENALRISLFNSLALIINNTWQNPVNVSSNQNTSNKQLPGRFKQSHTLRIENKTANITPFIEYITNSDMFYDTANNLNASNNKLINAGFGWSYHRISGTFEATNISNQRHDDFEFQPQPGRAYYANIRYKL